MFDLKLLAVACAAFFFVWKVFSKKKQQVCRSRRVSQATPLTRVVQDDETAPEEEEEGVEDLFKTRPHDIILTPVKPGDTAPTAAAKLRASYTQTVVSPHPPPLSKTALQQTRSR